MSHSPHALASMATKLDSTASSFPNEGVRSRGTSNVAGGSSRATPREVNQKQRHLPWRPRFARVPNRLVRLQPCRMMSPLAVSTYLESPEFPFDILIFDEASQVLPWDAIGAVYRGRQLVVAGDQKQLPPSTFFDRMVNSDDDSEDADDLGDFESVLDVLYSIGLPRKRLRWHDCSRREPLVRAATPRTPRHRVHLGGSTAFALLAYLNKK